MLSEVRREHSVPWSPRQFWAAQRGYWELNSGPMEEQYVLSTAELSLQPLFPMLLKQLLTETGALCLA